MESRENSFGSDNQFSKRDRIRLERIIDNADKRDVTFDLNRWFPERMRRGDPELLAIQKKGSISEAVSWLKSTTSEGMKYGTASREARLEEARKFAEKAETTVGELAAQHGIDLGA